MPEDKLGTGEAMDDSFAKRLFKKFTTTQQTAFLYDSLKVCFAHVHRMNRELTLLKLSLEELKEVNNDD